jgi:HAD superfamily hydrolase (TIGR01509 family)
MKLVIFDCDGVLVDSEPIANGVLARLLTEEGLPMTTAQARAAYQGRLLSEVEEMVARELGRGLPAGFIERYEREREREFRDALRAVDGVAPVVEQVRAAGVDVCVASQGKLSKTRLSLELTGLAELFAQTARFSGEEVPRGKPHPDLFLHAARRMGAEPEACVVVEDTVVGVRAAVSAGMRAVGYAGDADADALSDAGAETIERMSQLPVLLGLEG